MKILPVLLRQLLEVASFAEAWIEKNKGDMSAGDLESPPSRRRGLKIKRFANLYAVFLVASFAEAWIEKDLLKSRNCRLCRLLRGGVD